MKFDLTLTTILVFLVPGTLVFFGMPADLGRELQSLRTFQKLPTATEMIGAFAISFFIGALVDSLRVISVQPIVVRILKLLKHQSPSWAYFKHVTPVRLSVFEVVVEKSFEYYRLNANLCLAFLLTALMHVIAWKLDLRFLFFLGGFAIWLVIAVLSKRDTDKILTAFIKK